jgi:hypothetical protein
MLDLSRLTLARACAFCALLLLDGCKSKQDYLSVGKGTQGTNYDGGKDGGTSAKRDAAVKGGVLPDGAVAVGSRDGGLGLDASSGTMDAAALGLDGSIALPDGSLILQDGAIVLPDGQIIDLDAAIMRYAPELNVTTCAISDSDTFSTPVKIGDEGGFALVPGHTGFGLAYRGIGTGNCAQDLDVMHIPATSGFPAPRPVPLDCKSMTDVTLLGESDGWRLAWVDNFTEMAELHTLSLDLDLAVAPGQMRKQLTDNQLELEKKPVLKEVGGHPLAAWITENMNTGMSRITTRLLDGTASPIDIVMESDGHKPQALALSQMGMTAAAAAWVGPQENPGVWLLKLDANGAPVDAPMQLTDKVAVSSSIDLADRNNGGAAIYSIELDGFPQVRFRRLDENGQPVAVERTIVGPPLRAQGASLAALGGGYAVAYRALPGGDVSEPEVRLTFVTKEGNVIRDPGGHLVSFPIGTATLAQGRTYVSVSVEGEVMIAWIDADPSSGKNNLLKVVRRRLDCQ